MSSIPTQSLYAIKNILVTTINLQKENKFNFIPIIQGHPGMGKTAIVKSIAEETNHAVYYVSAAKPMEFFSGIPITDRAIADLQNKNLDNVGRAVWTKPEIIAKANELAETNENVLLFIDDIHVIGDGSSYFFELILEKSLNGHKLKENVSLIGAANSSSLSGYEGFPAAIINRMMLIKVNLIFEDWYKNFGIRLNQYITTFMKTNSEFVQEEENVESPFGTYRSWSELSVLLTALTQNGEDDIEILNKISNSFISPEASESLKTSILMQKTFDFPKLIEEDVIALPDNSIVNQIIFSNIVKYIKKEEHVDKIINLIKLANKNRYSSLVLHSILELVATRDIYNEEEIKNPINLVNNKIKIINAILVEIAMDDELNEYIIKFGVN